MPRKYVRKSESKYSQGDLKEAIDCLKKKSMTVVEASKRYNIPTSTLYSRISGSRGNNPRGRHPILTKDEEAFLVHSVKVFQSWQQPISPSTVRELARGYMLELGKKIPTSTSLRDWFSSFMNRWSNELKVMKTMKLEKVRSKGCTKKVVGKRERR